MATAAQTDNPVILNGAAGGVKDLGHKTEEHNRFFANAQNDKGAHRMTVLSPEPTVLSS